MKKAKKDFVLIKGYPHHPECTTGASISAMDYLEKFKVFVKGKERYEDVVEIEYKTKHGTLRRRYFPVMEEDTELGKVVKAINNGLIPERINNPVAFFVGKEIMIEVKHNKSKETGRTFANVVSVFPLEEDVDSDEEYDDEYDDDDTDDYDDDSDDDNADDYDDDSDDDNTDDYDDDSDEPHDSNFDDFEEDEEDETDDELSDEDLDFED
ncbi:hypothetical protein M4D70_23115 [Brevibacillus borstelensis]|uniref:hypothetical protein n=1 Tax=Brevibacillus borstelensis TaxID=45462 RepID=UPI00203FB667|nr:hypothetical protein [Brevibacillus borstelensis]MCM3625117.1 hypothetical protein [Brevibacillus borstelensis]